MDGASSTSCARASHAELGLGRGATGRRAVLDALAEADRLRRGGLTGGWLGSSSVWSNPTEPSIGRPFEVGRPFGGHLASGPHPWLSCSTWTWPTWSRRTASCSYGCEPTTTEAGRPPDRPLAPPPAPGDVRVLGRRGHQTERGTVHFPAVDAHAEVVRAQVRQAQAEHGDRHGHAPLVAGQHLGRTGGDKVGDEHAAVGWVVALGKLVGQRDSVSLRPATCTSSMVILCWASVSPRLIRPKMARLTLTR